MKIAIIIDCDVDLKKLPNFDKLEMEFMKRMPQFYSFGIFAQFAKIEIVPTDDKEKKCLDQMKERGNIDIL